MSKCVIFDLDGTLIDSVADLAAAVNHTRRTENLPPLPVKLVAEYVGEGPRLLLERAFSDLPGADIDKLLVIYKEYYQHHLMDLTTLYPGVKEGLAELHAAGIPMAVVTNKHDEAVHALLRKFDIDQYFKIIIGSGSGFPHKPDPAALLHILKTFNADFDGSWMVGDHFTDLEAGRRAGIKRALATWGFGNPKSETWDFAPTSFAELAKVIKN